MPVRPYRTASGEKRWQADYRNERRGVGRIKRSFATKKEADEWLAAAAQQTHSRYIGERERHTFGEALAKYLAEESPRKKTHRDDITNATALRYPIQDGRRWLLLEHTPIEHTVPALAAWLTEQRLVVRRRYLGQAYYIQRAEPRDQRVWYHQPDPTASDTPKPRKLVTDPQLLAALEAPGGRGPYASDTLRIRQVLAGRILRLAWKRWHWLEHDIAAHLELERPGRGRNLYLSEDQLLALIAAARAARLPNGDPDPVAPHFADLIAGAALIGWRRTNVRDLDWSRVVFPVHADTAEGRNLVQLGVIWAEAQTTKNGDPLAQPISDELETLLQARWQLRIGSHNLVFHDGRGGRFGDFRRRWTTAKRLAGVPADFRWHDLRHTWASHLSQRGVSDRHLQELGGWKEPKMVQRYSALRVEHLLEAVNRRG